MALERHAHQYLVVLCVRRAFMATKSGFLCACELTE
jgi:hypothetical protein